MFLLLQPEHSPPGGVHSFFALPALPLQEQGRLGLEESKTASHAIPPADFEGFDIDEKLNMINDIVEDIRSGTRRVQASSEAEESR